MRDRGRKKKEKKIERVWQYLLFLKPLDRAEEGKKKEVKQSGTGEDKDEKHTTQPRGQKRDSTRAHGPRDDRRSQ